jgi:hypothetical protein
VEQREVVREMFFPANFAASLPAPLIKNHPNKLKNRKA